MAQIIKHRRGTLAQLNGVTLNNGEIGIVSSSVANIGDDVVKTGLVIGHTDGVNRLPIARLTRGNATPDLSALTGGSNFNDMFYHEIDAKTLSVLHTGGNTNLDLTGNIANRSITGTIDATNFGNVLATKITGSFSSVSASLASRLAAEEADADFTAAQISGSWQGNNAIDISSDTNLVAGTGITLAGDTLNVDSAQTGITSLGSISNLTATNVNIDNGNIDGVTIGATSAVAGTFSTITSTGDITAQGNIYAQKYIVSSSVSHFTQSFSSGSTIFGDTSDDTHQFTGSLNVKGSINGAFTGSVSITDGAIGSDLQPVTLYADAGEVDNVVIGSETSAAGTFTTLNVVNGILPDSNDGAFIGAAGNAFSDLFLAEGGVINWDSSDITITQGGNNLTIAGTSQTHFDGIVSASRILTTGNSTLGDSTGDQHTISGIVKGFTKVSGSLSSTGSFGHLVVAGNQTIAGTTEYTGDLIATGNVSGSATSTGSFGRLETGKVLGNISEATNTALTTGRVPFATLNGTLADSSNLTFADNTLGVTGAITATGNVSSSASSTASFGHIIFDTGTIDGGSF